MQQKLVHQNHRQQARPGEAARDRMRRRRRLGDGVAIAAGELLAHMLDDFPATRLTFERLRHLLAELVQAQAAAFAASAGRGLHDPLDGEILRQLVRAARSSRSPRLAGLRRGEIGLRLFGSLRLFQILDRQLELLDEQLGAFG
jgi:hypothetical protein